MEVQGREHEWIRISDMNRQIGELTSLVKTLTEKFATSNREDNVANALATASISRSDSYVILFYNFMCIRRSKYLNQKIIGVFGKKFFQLIQTGRERSNRLPDQCSKE